MMKAGCSAWMSPEIEIFGVVAQALVVAEAVEVVMLKAGSPGRASSFHEMQVPRQL
jgi:hypothetical protein